MRWLHNAGWVAAVGALIAFAATRPDRKPPLDPNESRQAFEKMRADFEEKRAKREKESEREISRIRTEATLDLLRNVGRAYRWHLVQKMTPPSEADFIEYLDAWRSLRDNQPFAIIWEVDLEQMPGEGDGSLLAWEQTADKDGTRCVLMADGKTTRIVTADEFAKLPRAK